MFKCCLTTAFVALCFVYSPEPAKAQVMGTVTGTVIDSNGNPVEDAVVTYMHFRYFENLFSGVTDSLGKYEIEFEVTDVEEIMPSAFSLGQNYPNPFNPATIIPFTIENSEHVTLTIYNSMGQLVATVIDAYLNSGDHTVVWDGMDNRGNHVASGLYFYRLETGTYARTKKMLLLDGGANVSPAKASSFNGNPKSAKSASDYISYTVTITHRNIVPYLKRGLLISNNDVLDYTVAFRENTIPDTLTFASIPAVTEPYVMNPYYGGTYSVTLSPYEISTTEVTNAQYTAYLNEVLGKITVDNDAVASSLMANTPNIIYSNRIFSVTEGMEHWPVVRVTWAGAKAFAQYYGFDLPTEAEWQYAASGGRNYEYGTYDGVLDSTRANYNYYYVGHPTDVGSYPPNPFGIYDMSGNVAELCNDGYAAYPIGVYHDPVVPQASYNPPIVYRDFSWADAGNYDVFEIMDRSSVHSVSVSSIPIIGFRVVRR